MIPKVLLTYVHRPMCVGLFYKMAFRQAGCEVMTCGPALPEVYGFDNWGDDYMPPSFELPNEPVAVATVLAEARARGFNPDAVVTCDQYDHLVIVGDAPDNIPWAHVCVENFDTVQFGRSMDRRGASEFYMISHSDIAPLPKDAVWLPFGFDPWIHPYLGLKRDKLVCQIGSPYEPRPSVWNHLRSVFDTAPPWRDDQYHGGLAESARTIFGRVPNYRGMAESYNRSMTALSCSNVPFQPMRVFEAMAMGAILCSDDVGPIRACAGPPASEGGFWVAHDTTPQGHEAAVRYAVEHYDELADRALAYAYKGHTYAHRARQILERVGLKGACRMV